MADLGNRSFRRRVLGLLLLAVVLAHAPAFRGEILEYDDGNLLLGPDGAIERPWTTFFTETYYFAYLPFYGLSYKLEGAFAGATAWVFHLGNVLWHAAACYLVFLVLGHLLAHRRAALFGALLFAVHPLHVESVAWISGRKEVLSGFLFFLAWLLHLKAEEPGRAGRLVAAVLVFLAACFTKAPAIVLPGALAAAALLLPRYDGRRRAALLRTVPYFAAAVLPAAVHLGIGVRQGVVQEIASLGTRALYGAAAWGSTILRTVFPAGLSLDYPEARVGGVADAALPLAALAATVAAAVVLRRRRPVVAFGIAAFLVALAPFNDVIPATDVLVADRYAYLALFGAAACLAAFVRARPDAGVAIGCILVVAWTGLSFVSSGRFRDDETLWTATLEARDGSALAYVNRGLARAARGQRNPPDMALLDEAVADLEAGIQRARLKEHRIKAHGGLVIPLLVLGRTAAAQEHARDALELLEDVDRDAARRERAQVLHNRGVVRKALGSHAAAAADFVASTQLWPRSGTTYEAGVALLRAGRLDEAARCFDDVARHEPESPDPWLQRARIAYLAGERDDERRYLEEASQRAPGGEAVVEAWVRFWLDRRAPDYRKAAAELERLRPGSPARKRLEAGVEAQRALFHHRRGRAEDALAAAEKALAADLADPGALYELGQVFLDAGRYDDAIRCFRGAGGVVRRDRASRDAIARAATLKAYRFLREGLEETADQAFRRALDAQPVRIEAGGAPLRVELPALRATTRRGLRMLAVAAAVGDPKAARAAADGLTDLSDDDRLLAARLRGLVAGFVSLDFRAAEDEFEQILAERPGDAAARLRLAQIRLREGSGWLRTAREIDAEKRAEEGRAQIRRAVHDLTALIAKDPGFHLARLTRGEAYFVLDDLLGAKADYQAVRELDPGSVEAYLKEAVLHRLVYVRGGGRANLDSAIALLVQAVELDPNSYAAHYELGNDYHLLYDRQDDPGAERRRAFSRALLWYRRAMALDPRAGDARLEWARLVLKGVREVLSLSPPRLKEADQLLRRAEEDAPDVVAVWKERVRLNMRPEYVQATGTGIDEANAAAKKALDEVRTLAPKDPELPELTFLFHSRRGQGYWLSTLKLRDPALRARARELAADDLERALQARPDHHENSYWRELLRQADPDRIVAFDRERARSWFDRGAAAWAKQDWAAAADAFERALGLFPESPEFRVHHGLALARAGRLDAARGQLEKVANGPDGARFPEVSYELGMMYWVRRERATAKIWLRRYLDAMTEAGGPETPAVRRARELLEEK